MEKMLGRCESLWIQLVVFANPDLQFFLWGLFLPPGTKSGDLSNGWAGHLWWAQKTHPPLVIACTPNKILKTRITGWWFGTFFIFHFIYGMSSFPTDCHIFHRGRYTTNQLQEPEFRLRLQSLYIVYTAPRNAKRWTVRFMGIVHWDMETEWNINGILMDYNGMFMGD